MKQHPLEKIYHFLSRIQAKIFTVFLSPCFYKIGSRSVAMPPFRFSNLKLVQIGNNVTIHKGSWINVLNEVTGSDPKIIIGNCVSIGMDGFISAANKIILEDWVLLGRNVYISDHTHGFNNIEMPIVKQEMIKICVVKIGAETWLGNNSVILPGASIGRHCVIGANSIVNSNIPDYSVAVGSPAKIIRRFDLQKKKWCKVTDD